MLRKQYFDETWKRKDEQIKIPKESCLNRFTRLIITKQPPPYYSDYRDIETNTSILMSSILYYTRCKYGYSLRLNSSFISFDISSSSLLRNKKSKKSSILSVQFVRTTKSTITSNQILPTID